MVRVPEYGIKEYGIEWTESGEGLYVS